MTWTARNAGAEIVGGTSVPPAWIANVAGTLTLVEPPVERARPSCSWCCVAVVAVFADRGCRALPAPTRSTLLVVEVADDGDVDDDVDAVVVELAVVECRRACRRRRAPAAQIRPEELVCECLTFSTVDADYGARSRGCSMRVQEQNASLRLVEYDSIRRRLWILGQRCHHGATGALVASIGCAGLLADTSQVASSPTDPRAMIALALTGGALMLHDWKDRSIWFERGRGTQP